MNAILEEAIKEVRALPPEEQRQLRELAAGLGELTVVAILYTLLRKTGRSISQAELTRALSYLEEVDISAPWGDETALLPVSGRAALSSSIRGKYAHIRTSSDAFARLKQEEIKLEDRRR